MIKKLDWYGIRTFFGPFIFIFSVLFFIFMVQFAWQEMDIFVGKGLDISTIFKLLFYLGLTVIQLVLPLTVLLSAIMTYGGFGERYELAAMKSSGMSLVRIMLPVFLLVFGISVGLFFFSDRVVPQSQLKAQNMLLNIAKTKPAINFDPGVFINAVPGFSMKISQRSGENGEKLKDVFIHRDASAYENQQTIIAKKGIFEPAEDKRFLKLALFNGYYYEDEIQNKNRLQLERQPYQQIKFDTLVHYFDISEIVEKAIEQENVTDHYRFLSTQELIKRVDTLKIQNKTYYEELANSQLQSLTYAPMSENLDSIYKLQKKQLPFDLAKLNDTDRQQVFMRADENIVADLSNYSVTKSEISDRDEFIARHVLILVRNFSNSIMCLIFFLIGAPLGAIIRKGGVGMPVVVAIIIFVLFYLIYMYSENLAKNGVLDPYWSAWLPVLSFTPLGVLFTYKAMTDSNLFDINAYLEPLLRLKNKYFKSKNTEHKRYQ